MSSILKALKKLEAEKNTLNEEKRRDLSGEILKPQAEKRISTKWLWLLAGISSAIILTLTAALLRRSPPEPASVKPDVSVNSVVSPAVPAPDSTAVKPPEPDRKREPQLLPARIEAVKNIPLQTVPPQVNLSKQPRPELPGMKAPEPPKAEVTASKPLISPAEPALILNGIAWNRDSADRLAIINGQPSRVGEIVAGAVVVEILQDRARLTRNGRNFELTIGKSSAKD